MKSIILLLPLLLFYTVCCQQDFESYKKNYGLYNNRYDFPNYDISTNAPGYSVDTANVVQQTPTGLRIPLIATGNSSLYGKIIQNLVVEITYETTERLHVKIYDKDQKHITVPDSPLGLQRLKIPNSGGGRRRSSSSRQPGGNDYFEFNYTINPFTFQITRKSDSTTLFNTSTLVFEDQYLEISTHIPPTTNIYGLGEVLAPFKRTRNVTTIFARDAHDHYQNMYGAQPFYMDIRDNGASHGVFLLNAHGMDIVTTKDRITYKVIGGILDFYFFIPQDKKPNSVVQAYTELVGKPMMPAHWMLGYQNCRYNYANISHVEEVVQKHYDHGIPLEAQWIDIDYMDDRKDFTFDHVKFPQDKMINFSNTLHQNGQKFVVMVDPAIAVNNSYESYTRGQELDVFVKNVDGTEYQGQVWPGYTAFPDWWHPNITTYWQKEIVDWMNLLKLDGLWIDMNEPSSFCLGSCGSLTNDSAKPNREPWFNTEAEQIRLHKLQESALNSMIMNQQPPLLGDETRRNLLYPSYVINNGAGNLSEKTLAMTAQHYGNISHYDLHNLYGHAEGYITQQAILAYNSSTRPFLLSRSTFAGSGSYMGHWTGDILSSWEDMKGTIADIFNFQMYGISYSGSDICGFVNNATEELCTRWMELGSFYVFARNHNSDTSSDQEPYIWETTAEASRIALGIRYTLLPYFYTLAEESSRLGTGIWRPLIFEYPEHASAFANNDVQFLIGTDILVSPVLTLHAVTVDAQFPPGLWYDWYDYSVINSTTTSPHQNTITLYAPLTHIPVHIRGGSVLLTKTPRLLVKDTYSTPYNVIVALNEQNQATGRLYIDDGYSIHPERKSNVNFIFTGDTLTVNGQFDYPDAESIGNISIVSYQEIKYENATLLGGDNDTTFSLLVNDGEEKGNSSSSVVVVMTKGTVFLDKGFTLKFS